MPSYTEITRISGLSGSNSNFFEICCKVGSVEVIGNGENISSAKSNAARALKRKLDAYGKHCQNQVSKIEDFNSDFASKYESHNQIGGGGFGIVVKATNKSTKLPIAIKRVRLPLKDKDSEKIICGDVECFAKLTHPNIVRFYKHWFEEPPIGNLLNSLILQVFVLLIALLFR